MEPATLGMCISPENARRRRGPMGAPGGRELGHESPVNGTRPELRATLPLVNFRPRRADGRRGSVGPQSGSASWTPSPRGRDTRVPPASMASRSDRGSPVECVARRALTPAPSLPTMPGSAGKAAVHEVVSCAISSTQRQEPLGRR